jgi:hypothetical protein
MNTTPTEARAQALLDLVEADRAAKCAALEAAAAAQVTGLRRDAHASARARMRRAIEEERRMRRERVEAAEAALATRKRAVAQARDAALLEAGCAALPRALEARWANATARRAWIASTISEAASTLPRAPWRIVHAEGLLPDERDALAREVVSATGHAPSIVAEPGIAAGLSIAVGGTAIDATDRGLLSDRAEIEALLLDLIRGRAP